MTRLNPDKEWWTAAELADAGLPDLPNSRRGIAALAERMDWRARAAHARQREGRGGGWEYHWRLLPTRAQRELISRAPDPEPVQSAPDRDMIWTWFDTLPDSVKDKAKRNLRILQEVEALIPTVGTKFLAVVLVANKRGCSERTIWNFFQRVEGVQRSDWLAYLAPRHRANPPKGVQSKASPQFFDWLKASYLRLDGPGFSQSWRNTVKVCKANGLDYLKERTARRWLDENVSRVEQVFARQGEEGLRQCFPPQIRDRSSMTAMEMVNADCHKIDVFVNWPGIKELVRPQLIVFQDVYSGKMLSWAIDLNPNKVAVMQAFMKMVRTYGRPAACLFDNGMEFANKDITGGAKHRFRFTVSDAEPVGILGMLGIEMSFAIPGRGQSKPIERGFKDFCDDIARDPRFAGAYTGPNVLAKPANYMSRAVDLEDFIRVVEEGIHDHNARTGRRSATADGRSLDETFAESFEKTPIRRVTEEQLRLCLMAQYVRKLHKKNGQVTLYKNYYWAEWMSELAGQWVTARFNPEDLHEGANIYSMQGEFLGYAHCRQKSPFRDIASAKAAAREEKLRRRKYKALLEEKRPVSIEEFAAQIDAIPSPQENVPEASVVQLDRLMQIEQRKKGGGLIQRAVPVPDQAADQRIKYFAEEQEKRRADQPEAPAKPTFAELFYQALDIERRSIAGEPVSEREAAFLTRMRQLPEYRAKRKAYDRFGAQAIG